MSLILELVRHGEASPAQKGGDAARRLSPKGRADVARLAERLRAEAPRLTHVFVSPLARARETAAILLAGRAGAPAPEILRGLVPEGEPDELLADLLARGLEGAHVLLVSHEPLMGRFAEHLTGEITLFLTSTCVRVAFDGAVAPRRGRLVHRIHLPG